ncbi:MAG: cofactor-independent phosphoglycerate mutase [Desulfobacteraceae bacterium 4572_87]|nr:MAG: cofactor-independent phosphoglycerate mutase [Desulfobacteraceae bacterium 4572_87]
MKKETGTKYILLVGDGMGDYPLSQLGGKTPLEAAHTPNMDRIAACRIGLATTIPDGLEPGSDTANLSLMGYDPATYHTGRGPFEAASMGIPLGENAVAFRMNLVSLDRKSDDEMIMVSNSAGGITTEESEVLVEDLRERMVASGVHLYPGVAYRHLLVWDGGPENAETIPPHDVQDQNMATYLNPESEDPIVEMTRRSWPFLERHPVNLSRKKKGLLPANSIWLWGQGKRLNVPLFKDIFGLSGGVISAVDLLKGIGVYAGLTTIDVEGATGYLDTNYLGKATEALNALNELDFMFVHVEAPDEASHEGSISKKIQAIEDFDEKVVGRVLAGMEKFEDYRILVAADHFTPISLKTHTADPTLFAWADKRELAKEKGEIRFTERFARDAGVHYEKGHDLMPAFLGQS